MLGRARIGPDLANIGLRRPDATWQLVHLYDPKLETPGSIMPRYPFLFQSRPRGAHPSPDALPIPGDREIIPTPRARALVAYLMSLRSDIPLFDAPGPPAPMPAAPSTNQPASTASSTNAPAGTNAAVPANPAVLK
jgi:cytochrome c oxidase cbb3-type subunit 2